MIGSGFPPLRASSANISSKTRAAPAREPFVDRHVRAIFAQSVARAQTVLNHEDDAADDPTIAARAIPRGSGKHHLRPEPRSVSRETSNANYVFGIISSAFVMCIMQSLSFFLPMLSLAIDISFMAISFLDASVILSTSPCIFIMLASVHGIIFII